MTSTLRQIEVDTAVYAAIWKNHSPSDQNENDILRRILMVKSDTTLTKAPPLKKKRKWIDDVVDGFLIIGGGGYYSEIYASVRAARLDSGYGIPQSFEAIVRREIENHSSDSEAYLGKKDLFTASKGLGAGYWTLR